jgi:uncharacterized protein
MTVRIKADSCNGKTTHQEAPCRDPTQPFFLKYRISTPKHRTIMHHAQPWATPAKHPPPRWTICGCAAGFHVPFWHPTTRPALGVSDKTVSRYLDILEGTFMAWRLRPWHASLGKREVKAPKVYLRDTGLLHSLLGITDQNNLLSHPQCGASWEGFALGEVIRHTQAQREEWYFWALHSGAALDFLLVRGARRLGFEVKLTRSPKVTASLRTAQQALALDHL